MQYARSSTIPEMDRKHPMSELLGKVSRVSSGQTGRPVTRAWMCCFFVYTNSSHSL